MIGAVNVFCTIRQGFSGISENLPGNDLSMRDERCIAEHRGGTLKREQHIQLINWACLCAENVLRLIDPVDPRLTSALVIARGWAKGRASVGDARKASFGAHDVARESDDPVVTAVARAVGHAV